MSKVQYVVNNKGERTGVYLSYTHYHQLLEDLHDLQVLAERKSEEPITSDELKKRFKKRGLV